MKYNDTRWDTKASSSVTVVQGLAGTSIGGTTHRKLTSITWRRKDGADPCMFARLRSSCNLSAVSCLALLGGSKACRCARSSSINTRISSGVASLRIISSNLCACFSSAVRITLNRSLSISRWYSSSSAVRFAATRRRWSSVSSNTHSLESVRQLSQGGVPEHYFSQYKREKKKKRLTQNRISSRDNIPSVSTSYTPNRPLPLVFSIHPRDSVSRLLTLFWSCQATTDLAQSVETPVESHRRDYLSLSSNLRFHDRVTDHSVWNPWCLH